MIKLSSGHYVNVDDIVYISPYQEGNHLEDEGDWFFVQGRGWKINFHETIIQLIPNKESRKRHKDLYKEITEYASNEAAPFDEHPYD
jgi:hypothetical protein